MKIAIDIDGVLLDIIATFLEIFNKKHNTNYIRENVTNWEFFRDWNISEDEAFEIFYSIYKDTMNVPFIDESAPEYMKKLNQVHDVYILSTRDPIYYREIERKLTYHNIKKNAQYIDLILIHHKPYDSKSAHEFNVFVDDNPYLAETILKSKGKYLLLYDQPWNRYLKCEDNIIRVYNWQDVFQAINSLSTHSER